MVTHLRSPDGQWYSVADVRPGDAARARGAATATVTLGSGTLHHGQLARGGLLVSGATVSPDGRLGSGKAIRATPLAGLAWASDEFADLFSRPLAEAAAELLTRVPDADPEQADRAARELVGCDLEIVGGRGDHLLARELGPTAGETGLLVRLTLANGHPDLAHTANFHQLATRPGLRLRVLGRLDPDRPATLRPLAVGPVPCADATMRLPADWLDHADLGYDRLQGSHFPPAEAPPALGATPADPLGDAPLWRVRRLIELAVTGGRRAVAETARNGDARGGAASLRRSGFPTAADLTEALAAEADRRGRDVFGRIAEADADRYARAWLTTSTHLVATERALIRASWGTAAQEVTQAGA